MCIFLLFDFVNIFFRKKANALNAWSLLLFSMGIIGSACVLLINACETIAEGMGIAPYFIAVILASAATSLPDTILSYRDAIKGDYDDAIANALGSNIFDICFALGLPIFAFTLIKGPIVMPESTLSDVIELQISLIILTIISFYIFWVKVRFIQYCLSRSVAQIQLCIHSIQLRNRVVLVIVHQTCK